MSDLNKPAPTHATSGAVIKPKRINFAIMTYNALDSTKLCLESIFKNTPEDFNIFFRDNQSKDETRAWLTALRYDNVVAELGDENLGVPGGRNRLMRMIDPHLPEDGFVIFLDNDMELLPGWSKVYLDFFSEHEEAGIASAHGHPMLVYSESRQLLPFPKHCGPVDVACGGFCCWIRAKALRAVGDFDQKLGLFWHEDDDYTIRTIGAGWEAYSLPHVPVIHHEHKSGVANPGIVKDGSPENQKYLADKWRKLGLLDINGRPLHKHKAEPKDIRRQLASGLYGRGFDPDSGGYRLVQKYAKLSFEKALFAPKIKFKAELKAGEAQNYDIFPFSVEIIAADKVLAQLHFTSSAQTQSLELELDWADVEGGLEFRSSASFVPILCNVNQWDQRQISFYISGIEIKAANQSAQTKQYAVPSISAETSQQGLHFISPLLEHSEEALFTRSILRKAKQRAMPVRAHSQWVDEIYVEGLKLDRAEYALQTGWFASSVKSGICVSVFPEVRTVGESFISNKRSEYAQYSKHVALVKTDYDRVPAWYAKECDKADEIWVCSTQTRDSLIRAGSDQTRIKLLPLGVDTELFDPSKTEALGEIANQGFTFLAECTWDFCDGWDLLLKAYLTSFKASDQVCLVLKHDSPYKQSVENVVNQYSAALGVSAQEAPRVLIVGSLISDSLLPRIYKSVNCFVRAARADGLGLGALRAMAMELPVIATNWGAALDFINESCSYPIPVKGLTPVALEVAAKAKYLEPGSLWAEPDLEALSALMKEVFLRRGEAQAKGKLARQEILQTRSLQSSLEWIEKAGKHLQQNTEVVTLPEALPSPQVLNGASHLRHEPSPSVEIVNKSTDAALTIGVDARTLTFPETAQRGIGHYTVNHLCALISKTPHWNYLLFLEDLGDDEHIKKLLQFSNVSWRSFNDPFPKLDLYHIPDPMSLISGFDSPFRIMPKDLPLSVIFYDLIPLAMHEFHFDQWDPSRQIAYMSRLRQLRESKARVLAISEHTRQDLHTKSGMPLEQIKTVMAGLNKPVLSAPLSQDFIQSSLKKHGLSTPFFLAVGGLDMHKDFTTTAGAFIMASQHHNMQLAVVGSKNDPYKESYRDLFERHNTKGVVFTGYLSAEELQAFYLSAQALVFPSRYEGFGLPALEAMANGCPVISVNASSIPEVCGEAAVLLKPGDAEGMAKAMLALAADETLRDKLRLRGLEQAKKFSWDKVADLTISEWSKMLRPSKIEGLFAVNEASSQAALLLG